MGVTNHSGPLNRNRCARRILIRGILLFVTGGIALLPCTVVSIDTGGIPFGGTNEDWNDPRTIFTIIPPENGKYGWVRFSYKSRFPQGGMNEHGLWWDATGVPYLEMPKSEAEKQEYFGPLMERVMEECRTVNEAVLVFSQYYCNDQYKAQYLIGDASGDSVIIEGDSHIRKNGDWQLITNFYHSFPELGGYPCSRYSAALELIRGEKQEGIGLVRDILAASVQAGIYPTQYSCIFDPLNKYIYIHYKGNFTEFLKVSSRAHEFSRYQETDLPLQFSDMTLLSPADGETIHGSSVTLTWSGEKSSTYELLISDGPSFNRSLSFAANGQGQGISVIFIPPVILLSGILVSGRGRGAMWGASLLMISGFILVQGCAVSGSHVDDTLVTFSKTVDGLTPGVTYHWKIEARNENGSLTSETVPGTFALAADVQLAGR